MAGRVIYLDGAFVPGERATVANALPALGATTFDVYLNTRAFWHNVPAAAWRYKISDYQVVKKWLSYRERPILGCNLTLEEVQYSIDGARRILQILLTTTCNRAYSMNLESSIQV